MAFLSGHRTAENTHHKAVHTVRQTPIGPETTTMHTEKRQRTGATYLPPGACRTCSLIVFFPIPSARPTAHSPMTALRRLPPPPVQWQITRTLQTA